MGYTIPLRNRPNGYPGLSADGDLVGNIIVRTGTAAQLSHVVLAPGEYAYAADTKKLVMGDGATIFADLSGIGTRSVVAVTDFIEVPGRDDMDIVFNVEVYGTPILMEPRRDGQRLTIIAGYAPWSPTTASCFTSATQSSRVMTLPSAGCMPITRTTTPSPIPRLGP